MADPQATLTDPGEWLKKQSGVKPDGASPVKTLTDPGEWLAAQPKPDAAKPRGQVFWETIGGQALQDLIGGASRDPEKAQKAVDTFKGLIHGLADEPKRVWDQLSRSGEAMTKGDILGAASHLAGATPFVGKTALDVQKDAEKGDYGSALERTAGMILPFAAPHLPAVADATVTAVKPAATFVKAGVKAAAPDVAKGAALVAAGTGLGEIPGMGMPARIALEYPGVHTAFKGVKKGIEAGKAATLAERLKAATTKMAPEDPPAGFNVASGSTEARGAAMPPPVPGYQPPVSGAMPNASVPAATVAENAGAANPILDVMAQKSGFESFAAAPPEAQAFIKNFADQQSAPAPVAQPSAPQAQPQPFVAQPPAGPSKTIAQLLQEEVAARKAPQAATAPIAAAQQPIPGAQQPVSAPLGVNTPLRPPIRQGGPQEPVAAPPAPVAAEPVARTLPQVEAAMVRKAPAIAESPTSQYTSSGERKSPDLRATEITGANRTAKAQRFAQVLHESGITAQEAAQIEAGMLSDTQIQKGAVPRWGNIAQHIGEKSPSDLSVPEIIGELRKLEKAKSAAAKNPKALAAAEALKSMAEEGR